MLLYFRNMFISVHFKFFIFCIYDLTPNANVSQNLCEECVLNIIFYPPFDLDSLFIYATHNKTLLKQAGMFAFPKLFFRFVILGNIGKSNFFDFRLFQCNVFQPSQ